MLHIYFNIAKEESGFPVQSRQVHRVFSKLEIPWTQNILSLQITNWGWYKKMENPCISKDAEVGELGSTYRL